MFTRPGECSPALCWSVKHLSKVEPWLIDADLKPLKIDLEFDRLGSEQFEVLGFVVELVHQEPLVLVWFQEEGLSDRKVDRVGVLQPENPRCVNGSITLLDEFMYTCDYALERYVPVRVVWIELSIDGGK